MVTASEARDLDGYRDCSNRLLDGWRTYDAEAAPPHSDPQLRSARNGPPCPKTREAIIPPLKGALTLMVPFRIRGFGTLFLPTGVLSRPMVY